MSASLPCVSFNCVTGPKDLIKHGYSGYLIEVGDIENFSLTLNMLMENAELRSYVGFNAKEVANSLNFENISNKYFDFLVETYYQTNDK